MEKKTLITLPISILALSLLSGIALSSPTITTSACNARVDVTVAGNTRSTSTASGGDCQSRVLAPTAGFSLSTPALSSSVVADSSAMVSAGGEMYESFVSSSRDAAVLLTPNRALMMSHKLTGNDLGLNWDLGLVVQPVTSASAAWLIGTYAILRSDKEVKSVKASQSSAALSQIFDPSTLTVSFAGTGACTVSNYSSWYSYELTKDAGALNSTVATTTAGIDLQPDGANYGFHQVAYAGIGATPSQDTKSSRTYLSCTYTVAADGMVKITYGYDDGTGNGLLPADYTVTEAYFMSSDLRYLVATDDNSTTLTPGYELGLRVNNSIAGTQKVRNDSIAYTYLFNGPITVWEGSTGPLSGPYTQSVNSDKATECLSTGKLVLSTTAYDASWNTCTLDQVRTCSVRGEEGYGETSAAAGNGALRSFMRTNQRTSVTSTDCRYQLASNSNISLVVTIDTPAGAGTLSMDGAVADNQEAFVLRGKYAGADITNPDSGHVPSRPIKDVLWLQTLVALKYTGTLTADPDADSHDNYGEFTWTSYQPSRNKLGKISNIDGLHNTDDLVMTGPNIQVWDTAGNVVTSYNYIAGLPESGTAVLVATPDVNGDGVNDMVFQAPGTGNIYTWVFSNNGATVNTNWLLAGSTVMGSGDFDGDGDGDLVLQNSSTGDVFVVLLQNGQLAGYNWLGAFAYTVKAVGDINNDGTDDIIMQSALYDIATLTMSNGKSVKATWQERWPNRVVIGTGDANGDGTADIYTNNNGDLAVIPMLNGNYNGGYWLGTFSGYTPYAIADVDGDGLSDYVMQDVSGNIATVTITNTFAVKSAKWIGSWPYSIKGAIDTDGDLDADVVIQDGSGNVGIIEMQNGVSAASRWIANTASTVTILPKTGP